MDDIEGSFTAPHDSGVSVNADYLAKLGIQYTLNPDIEKVAIEQGYKNRDEVGISREALGDEEYKNKLNIFKVEHLHTDIEARLILDGSGYFDVRDRLNNNEKWIRIAVEKGDLIILPPGIFHRFTTDDNGYTRAMRLFTVSFILYNMCALSNISARTSQSGSHTTDQMRLRRIHLIWIT